MIDTNDFIVYRDIAYRQHIATDKIERRVDLIKTVMDMDDRCIRASVDSGAVGLVIEAMGRGNVSPKVMEGIRYAVSKGVQVVVVSRCYAGRVFVSYGYEGGGKELADLGVIMGGDMRGPKARLKLMIALGKTQDKETIKALFEEQSFELM